ncbi:alpha-E domain-containing protein [Acidihalobacter ferrooxydans]|uniref:DUF403 domain-containing protein n=1 Tax=Acidihalobacter ferrooxydans TaxID=1765967 RepID=A0A1P8UDP8_9GAMM|nr:alpha-E domain-containing protein [Acidihalobacter ferrooxydans]APZ41991.1 hypothetical protein BW247_01825 [Acidihalobacter ferrooxydans]
MLSRVAERIYWMARYAERAENIARLINVNTLMLLDLPRGVTLSWDALIAMTGASEDFAGHYNEANERNVVKFLVADTRNPGSLLSSLGSARENARTIRDIIPREAWESINELYQRATTELPVSLARGKRYEALLAAVEALQQMNGILSGGMLHDAGYEFLRLGRNLERADMITRSIDVRTADVLPPEMAGLAALRSLRWMSLLRSLSAYQAYRQQVQGAVKREDVLDFLFKNAEFPRAVRHCVGEVSAAISRLPRAEEALTVCAALDKQIARARVCGYDDPGVHRFVDRVQKGLGDVHAVVGETWFLHTQPTRKKRRRAARPRSKAESPGERG